MGIGAFFRLVIRLPGVDREIEQFDTERVARTAGFAVRGFSFARPSSRSRGSPNRIRSGGLLRKSRGPQRRWSALPCSFGVRTADRHVSRTQEKELYEIEEKLEKHPDQKASKDAAEEAFKKLKDG